MQDEGGECVERPMGFFLLHICIHFMSAPKNLNGMFFFNYNKTCIVNIINFVLYIDYQ